VDWCAAAWVAPAEDLGLVAVGFGAVFLNGDFVVYAGIGKDSTGGSRIPDGRDLASCVLSRRIELK
jgi:hypothetical protein